MIPYIFPKYMGNVRGAGVGNNRKKTIFVYHHRLIPRWLCLGVVHYLTWIREERVERLKLMGKSVLNLVNRLALFMIYILQQSKRGHFTYYAGLQPPKRFGVISFEPHMITELRKDCFYSPTCGFKHFRPRPVVPLVAPHGRL